MAQGYGNYLKWTEQAMFIADLVNARQRGLGVAPESLTAKLRHEGMREDDVLKLLTWLRNA